MIQQQNISNVFEAVCRQSLSLVSHRFTSR